MYCRYCGRELTEGANFCTSCGGAVVNTSLPEQTAQHSYVSPEQTAQPTYIAPERIAPPYAPQQQSVRPYVAPPQPIQYVAPPQYVRQNVNDAPSLGFAILCFIWPILGLILYLVWKDNYPLRAKSCAKGAIASIITYVVIGVLFSLMTIVAALNSDYHYSAIVSFIGLM